MKTWMHKLVHFVWPVVAVFAVTVLLLLLIGVDLAQAFRGFFYGLFGNTFQIGEIFVKSTPLLLAGLGCSIGFHCGFINLGAEGQLYIGALASSVVAIFLACDPDTAHVCRGIYRGRHLGFHPRDYESEIRTVRSDHEHHV